MRDAKWKWAAAIALTLMRGGPAKALVGPARRETSAPAHVAMVLDRAGDRAGFCSAAVISRDVLLTAAHCVTRAADMRIFYRTAKGAPMFVPVAALARDPGYRPNAIRRRERSIDLALVRAAQPLPDAFAPISIGHSRTMKVGERFLIEGFGVAREGAPQTSGILRAGVVAAQAPLSRVLLWASDPDHRGLGACQGDSGGPVLTRDGSQIVAIMDWASGKGGGRCGALTQATLVAPRQAWIERVMRSWSALRNRTQEHSAR
ncbi:MAG TPA: S1 family peptidase [Beijerinckiaceae bacterium]|nr:S1 family peptidase [Beijerinckiaceae bacterium]